MGFTQREFLILATAATVVLYVTLFSQSTLSPDETVNLLIGKKMLQMQYPDSFLHRMPLVPLMVSFLFLVGLPSSAALFLIPLVFVALSVPVTYFFAREVSGEKAAMLSTVALMAFFAFWRWGTYVITDLPLMVFMTLSLMYFFRGLRDARNFYVFGAFLGLSSVTKLSFIILPFCLLAYVLAFGKAKILQKREFIGGMLIAAFIFSAFYIGFSAMGQGTSDIQLDAIGDRLSDSSSIVMVQVLTGAEYTSATQFLQLVLFPLLLFAPFGFFGRVKMKTMLLLYISLFLLLFVTVWVVRLRYFSPLYPVAMLFIAEGYLFLRAKSGKRKMLVDAAFVALLSLSLLSTAYLISLDSGSLWGAEEIESYTSGLDGLVASAYLPHYLNLTGDVLMNETAMNSIFYGNFSQELLEQNGIKYVVLSLYDEWNRMPDASACFHPAIGPFEASFMCREYSNGRVPPDYTFASELYKTLESGPAYERIHEIRRDGQVVFVVYRVTY
jgi:4-amino-4-deoxy-L-arabinose transferase-like glycosyltransferase